MPCVRCASGLRQVWVGIPEACNFCNQALILIVSIKPANMSTWADMLDSDGLTTAPTLSSEHLCRLRKAVAHTRPA